MGDEDNDRSLEALQEARRFDGLAPMQIGGSRSGGHVGPREAYALSRLWRPVNPKPIFSRADRLARDREFKISEHLRQLREFGFRR